MAIPVMMPKQGQSVESCLISQWYKKKGDNVKIGDLLFSYETDKASFEEEAKTEGILLEIFYGEGDEVPVLSNVAMIGQAGESVDEFRPGESPAPKVEAPKAISVAPETTSVTSEAPLLKKRGRPAKNKTAELAVAAVSTVIDSIESTIASVPSTTSLIAATDAKVRVSPRARHIADRKGIDLTTVKGTGPKGRIIARDVENVNSTQSPTQTLRRTIKSLAPTFSQEEGTNAPSVQQVTPKTVTAPVTEFSDAECEVKKLTNIRKLIAKAMYESLQNSAQLTHHLSADVRKLLAYREEVKKAQKSDPNYPNITLNDMVCWAVIRALEKFPEANSQFLGDSIKTFKKVHLALAVDTPRGLMVPVLKNASDLSLKGLSDNFRTLADACRKGSIDPDLLQSTAGTFTVSNLGNYGVEMFTPIINLPQVAILGVNTIVQRPADIGGGIMAFVPYIGLSLTYDHRAIDGGPATLFLREIKTQIENFHTNA